jgi:asparagine synthase (glutamine-hydrolysing)
MDFTDPSLQYKGRYGCVPPRYSEWHRLDEFRPDIFNDKMREALAAIDPEHELVESDKTPMNGQHPLNASLYLEAQTRLANWILVIGDRCSMAHGVELRVPFLDNEVVELCAQLPVSLKLRRFEEKYLLRVAARGLIPEHILHRRKFPFSTPISEWFLDAPLPGFVEEMLSTSALREIGIFRPEAIQAARAELAQVRQTHRHSRLVDLIFGVLGVQTLAHVFDANSI